MLMKSLSVLAILSLLAITLPLAISDPRSVQDFCVGVNSSVNGVFVNGKFCKDPKLATADDFFFRGLIDPKDPTDTHRANITLVSADNFLALNTLGISFARADYEVNGVQPPHTHPRASEFLVVTQGTLSVGFVTADQDGNRLFAKTLNVGDVFLFPEGLIHYQANIGDVPAVAFTALNSQNPGLSTTADAVFGCTPSIDPDVLARAFKLDRSIVVDLQNKFKTASSFTAV
ncbi:unnamed protein product [Thlaspi arvense]|uniref:Germin-like protein n=1 Tax=Thlaspi arvense TaxID=13288 RepID=A0AAU9TA29_THLAR|nr:unnamed protein product [Thlaspi arvense]